MNSAALSRAAADAVLVTHVAFVVFVILGLVLIIAGGIRRWSWIRNPWFRLGHLAAIGLVVIQAWLGAICPLTILEMHLREQGGEPTYDGAFIGHWLQRVLYYEAPPWVFIGAYTAFGLAVAFSWRRFPPRPFRSAPARDAR